MEIVHRQIKKAKVGHLIQIQGTISVIGGKRRTRQILLIPITIMAITTHHQTKIKYYQAKVQNKLRDHQKNQVNKLKVQKIHRKKAQVQKVHKKERVQQKRKVQKIKEALKKKQKVNKLILQQKGIKRIRQAREVEINQIQQQKEKGAQVQKGKESKQRSK